MGKLGAFLAIAVVLVLLGCGLSAPTPVVIADCGVTFDVEAWIDQNSDGVRDSGEPPLSGVTFVMDDVLRHFDKMARRETTDLGTASFYYLLGGCPEVALEVYAEVPDGYRATTSTRKSVQSQMRFLVGFVPKP